DVGPGGVGVRNGREVNRRTGVRDIYKRNLIAASHQRIFAARRGDVAPAVVAIAAVEGRQVEVGPKGYLFRAELGGCSGAQNEQCGAQGKSQTTVSHPLSSASPAGSAVGEYTHRPALGDNPRMKRRGLAACLAMAFFVGALAMQTPSADSVLKAAQAKAKTEKK